MLFRYAPLLLFCSCAFMQTAMKPASVGAAAAGGAMVGGPAGAAAAAAGTAAAWDVVDAEEGEAIAQEKLDVITNAALRGELKPLETALATADAKVEKIIFWLFVALALYIFKQPIWAWLTRRRIKHVQSSTDRSTPPTP